MLKYTRKILVVIIYISIFCSFSIKRNTNLIVSGKEINVSGDSAEFFVFSTFLGGSHNDYGKTVMLGERNTVNVYGSTSSSDFPIQDAFNETHQGLSDCFLTKLNLNGTLNYSTYIGGNSLEFGYNMQIDENGTCYMVGSTSSEDFPTKNAYNATFSGEIDGFISIFGNNTSLNFSTYFGGNDLDWIYSIAVDNYGAIYIAGSTTSLDFPTLNAMNETCNGGLDSFIAKFNSDYSINYSTYLGGSSSDWVYDICVDTERACYITGTTDSPDFPIFGSRTELYSEENDVFITKLNPDGSLNFSTLLGGKNDEESHSIAIDSEGRIIITGYTNSPDFPTHNAIDSSKDRDEDIFIACLNADGSINFSTFYGGGSTDIANDIVVTPNNDCYIIGTTTSSDFPIMKGYISKLTGESDVLILKISCMGNLEFSTLIGGNDEDFGEGLAVISNFGILITGYTYSANFPVYNAFDSTYGENGHPDGFLSFIYDPLEDYDGDGIPNYWEYEFSLDLTDPNDAQSDMDGDGLSNLQEFLLGTNPNDDDSDNDGFLDGNDKFPTNFMLPTGLIICISSFFLLGISFYIVVKRPFYVMKCHKIKKILDSTQNTIENRQYSEANCTLKKILPKIKRLKNGEIQSRLERLEKMCEINSRFSQRLEKQKQKIYSSGNFEEIHSNLVIMLKDVHRKSEIEFIDKEIESEIVDLLRIVSEKIDENM